MMDQTTLTEVEIELRQEIDRRIAERSTGRMRKFYSPARDWGYVPITSIETILASTESLSETRPAASQLHRAVHSSPLDNSPGAEIDHVESTPG